MLACNNEILKIKINNILNVVYELNNNMKTDVKRIKKLTNRWEDVFVSEVVEQYDDKTINKYKTDKKRGFDYLLFLSKYPRLIKDFTEELSNLEEKNVFMLTVQDLLIVFWLNNFKTTQENNKNSYHTKNNDNDKGTDKLSDYLEKRIYLKVDDSSDLIQNGIHSLLTNKNSNEFYISFSNFVKKIKELYVKKKIDKERLPLLNDLFSILFKIFQEYEELMKNTSEYVAKPFIKCMNEIKKNVDSNKFVETRLVDVLTKHSVDYKAYFHFEALIEEVVDLINLYNFEFKLSSNKIKEKEDEKNNITYNDNSNKKAVFIDDSTGLSSEQIDVIAQYVISVVQNTNVDICELFQLLSYDGSFNEKLVLKEIVYRLKKVNVNHNTNDVLIMLNNKLKDINKKLIKKNNKRL